MVLLVNMVGIYHKFAVFYAFNICDNVWPREERVQKLPDFVGNRYWTTPELLQIYLDIKRQILKEKYAQLTRFSKVKC